MKHIFVRNGHRLLFVGIFLALTWIFGGLVHARAISEAGTKRNFLWCIETEKSSVYLMGSMHFLRSDSFPLSTGIEGAYNACNKIVFETKIDGMKDPIFQAEMMTLGLYSGSETLRQNLSEQTYALLEKKAVAAGLSMAALDRFRPWLCAVTLTAIELKRLGFDPNYGIDMYFFEKAKKDEKETAFLETPEYQLKAFTEMAEREEESFLIQTLKDLEVVKTTLSDIVESWKTGDAARLESIMSISFKDHPDVYDRLVIQRNRKWIGQIEDFMKQDKNVLIIVGAGHLVGTENIIQLLREKGYKVTQR